MSSTVYDVPELFGNKKKPTNERFGLWLQAENLFDNNLVTDVGNINYTIGEELLAKDDGGLLTISEPFCDNIMLVKLCTLEDCEKMEKRKLLVKEDVFGSFNRHLREKFGSFVAANYGVKGKAPYLLKDDNCEMSKKISQLFSQEELKEIEEKYEQPVGVPFKVELAEVSLAILMEQLPRLIEELRKDEFYLMDFDITLDIAGIFNKKGICDFLTSNHEFCYEGEDKPGCNVIKHNDDTAGIDCLTWINTNTRVKIYNKFVCQMTSPGVNKQIGNHIINFVECPDKRLRETFASDKAKTHGITRLEATMYNYSSGDHSPEQTLDLIQSGVSVLTRSKEYLHNAPIFSVSIAKMWTKLTDTLQNSCCLVFNDLLQYVYWGNGKTKKLTGVQIELPNDDPESRKSKIDYVISAFSFNSLPANFIEVVEDAQDKSKIIFYQKCFIKEGETYFTKSTNLTSTIPLEVNLARLGLVNTKNVLPQILRGQKVKKIELRLPYPLKEIQTLPVISIKSDERRKLELDELGLKRRKAEFEAGAESIPKRFKHSEVFLQEIKKLKDLLVPYFRSEWSDFSYHGEYTISAFTVFKRGSYEHVGVLGAVKGSTHERVYYVKGFKKKQFQEKYKNKENLKQRGYVVIGYNDESDIICLPGTKPFCTITTNGMVNIEAYGNNGTFPNIVRVFFFPLTHAEFGDFTLQNVIQFNNSVTMTKIEEKVNIGNCQSLEKLKQGEELAITALKKIRSKIRRAADMNRPGPSSEPQGSSSSNAVKKLRYILKLEGKESFFVSNHWLEEAFENGNVNLYCKIKMKLDMLKSTPLGKKKERVVFCV